MFMSLPTVFSVYSVVKIFSIFYAKRSTLYGKYGGGTTYDTKRRQSPPLPPCKGVSAAAAARSPVPAA